MRHVLDEKYESPEQLKRAMAFYALANGYKLYYEVNNPRRLLAKCCRDEKNRKCPFRTYEYGTLIISNWIARNYAKKIMINPCIKVKEIINLILKKYKCKVTISQARRGKMKALQQYETCFEDYYGMLWSNASEILNSNPGSTCKMSVDLMLDVKNYFSRFYVCFKGLKEGELMSVVRRYENNQIYPIAWAIVNVENKDNWSWLMELLINDLGLGTIEAAKQVMPLAEYRQCARHIYANFRKKYTSVQYRILFWKAAKATYPTRCEKAMKEIQNARRKPIINMLEDIGVLCMERLQKMREKHEKWNDGICPNIRKKLEKYKDLHRHWNVIPSGESRFEVRNGYGGFKVDERSRTCSCSYNKDVFVNAYKHYIEGMNGMDQWPSTDYQNPLPPIKRRMPGRPPHKKKRDVMEDDGNRTMISRKGQINHYTLCKKTGHNQKACPSKPEGTVSVVQVFATGEIVSASVGKVIATGEIVYASGGNVSASGEIVSARGGNVSAKGGKVSAREGKVSAKGRIVTASGGNVTARDGKVTARGEKVSARGGKVSARGRKVSATPSPQSASPCTPPPGFEMSIPDTVSSVVRSNGGVRIRGEDVDSGSNNINKLRTINGKVVTSRERRDGSKSRMYPGGIRPIGFGVSWDPIDGQTMLGVKGITPEDCIIHAQSQSEIELTQSQPIASQEPEPRQQQPKLRQQQLVPRQQQPVIRRTLERITQIFSNKPLSPGPDWIQMMQFQ
ncbi:hypothetical protein Tco_0761501 [Tanacetum coccineum]